MRREVLSPLDGGLWTAFARFWEVDKNFGVEEKSESQRAQRKGENTEIHFASHICAWYVGRTFQRDRPMGRALLDE